MSGILVEVPLRAGDRIRLLEMDGTLIKEGTLMKNPSGSRLPYSEDKGSLSFHFDDGVFEMANREYRIEIFGAPKGFVVRPVGFKEVIDNINHLLKLQSGDAYDAFKQSIVNDFLARGYSEAVALQIIGEMASLFSK